MLANGSCNLASINLFAFVRNPFTEDAVFDYERFIHVTEQMTWGLDELLTILGDRHALPEQKEHVKKWREVGLGIMGLADLALAMNVSYGSREFVALIEAIMHTMANVSAQASARRAKELGVFPKYNYDYISNSNYFNEVYTDKTKKMIKTHGLRNSRLLSIAPTGSISNVLGISGGVEPFYSLSYWRKVLYGDKNMIQVMERTPQLLANHLGVETAEQLPEWAKVTSQNINYKDRARVQSKIQKYVDTGVSSTFNLPNEATIEDVMKIYELSWIYGLKGATVFRDNCAKIGILSGKEAWEVDSNPATPPIIEVVDEVTDLKTGEIKVSHYQVEVKAGGQVDTKKINVELCPECGSPMEKRDGCKHCSNDQCFYQACSI